MNKTRYYRKSAHATYRCEYHFVWVPKYRYKILMSDVKTELRGTLTELCDWLDITIKEAEISCDHIHMYLSVPPKLSPSKVMQILKGRSAEQLRKKFPKLKKKYWGLHLWARGYFVSTVGINEEVIRRYIRNQHETMLMEEQLKVWKDL